MTQERHMAKYHIEERRGWFYVVHNVNGNVSRAFVCHAEARVALYGLAVRDLINE